MEDTIGRCKERAAGALEHFLRSLSHVPEDKLTWKPVPTANSALQIAAHCAGFSGGFASLIRAGKLPDDVEEFVGPIQARIQSISTVEEAEAMLREGIAETLAALDTVLPEQLDSTIDNPALGPTPFLFFMNIPADHLIGHAYQIDYLQTCWGDMEVYV